MIHSILNDETRSQNCATSGGYRLLQEKALGIYILIGLKSIRKDSDSCT